MKKSNGGTGLARQERLQVMLTSKELKAVENFRFDHRMPSRAAAVRELLRRGIAEGRCKERKPTVRPRRRPMVSQVD